MAAYRSGEVSPLLSAMKLDTAIARGRTQLNALLTGREPGAS